MVTTIVEDCRSTGTVKVQEFFDSGREDLPNFGTETDNTMFGYHDLKPRKGYTQIDLESGSSSDDEQK